MIIDYFCFHDTDLIQEGETFVESEKRVATITYYIKDNKLNLELNYYDVQQTKTTSKKSRHHLF